MTWVPTEVCMGAKLGFGVIFLIQPDLNKLGKSPTQLNPGNFKNSSR